MRVAHFFYRKIQYFLSLYTLNDPIYSQKDIILMDMKTRTKTAHYLQNKHKNPHTRTVEILPAHRYLKKGRLCGFTAHMATLVFGIAKLCT